MFFYLIRSLTGAFCLVAKRKLCGWLTQAGPQVPTRQRSGKKNTQTTWTRRAARKKKRNLARQRSGKKPLWKKTGGDSLPVGAQARSLSRAWGRTAASDVIAPRAQHWDRQGADLLRTTRRSRPWWSSSLVGRPPPWSLTENYKYICIQCIPIYMH